MSHIRFHHGLGDCSNFAHTLPLYTKRGYDISVDCTLDKSCLFRAGGATVQAGGNHHDYLHPGYEQANITNHWSMNKAAYNLSLPPMPNIGLIQDLWQEFITVQLNLDAYVSNEDKLLISDLLKALPRPIILTSFQGNTGSELKNINHDLQRDILLHLISQTDGTVIALDWDQRVYKMQNSRVRHLQDDMMKLNLPQLYCLMESSNLLLGIDSGPLHFARFSKIPALGLWVRHHPSHFVLPRTNSINMVGKWASAETRYRRLAYNIVEAELTGSNVANLACQMLAKEPVLFNSLLSKCGEEKDRDRSIRLFFEKLPKNPVVVETGCIREEEDFAGAGYFTYLCGYYLSKHGGQLTSVDISPEHCHFARTWTQGMPVEVIAQDSVSYLASCGAMDALYLDSWDVYVPGYGEHCLAEVKAAMDKTKLILIDDSPFHNRQWNGKGMLAIPFLLKNGWKLVYAGYQVLLEKC